MLLMGWKVLFSGLGMLGRTCQGEDVWWGWEGRVEIQAWCLGLRPKLGFCGDGEVVIHKVIHSFTHSFNNYIWVLTQSQALMVTCLTLSQMIRSMGC